MEIFVGFGASETFMTALSRGLLDSCVTACEGAGTVIANSPTLVQGIGSRISGLVETTPIPKLIHRIEGAGGTVLDPVTAALDQGGRGGKGNRDGTQTHRCICGMCTRCQEDA